MPVTDADEQLTAALRLAIAALVGVGVGLERQWSGHATGPAARFAGLRTFFLLGLLGGAAGLLAARGWEIVGATLIAAAVALTIAAYVAAVRRAQEDLDATTEAAALVVIALGALSGAGWIALAAGAGSIAVLALNEKTRLHDAVSRLSPTELNAAMRFAVLALVVLPLLPRSVRFAGIEVHARALWGIVLFFTALNFAAYLARRALRSDRGYGVTGMLGGFISSTAVTLSFARRSSAEPALAVPLAAGVIGACTVLVPRVLVVSTVLNGAVAVALLPYVLPVMAVGAVGIWWLWRSSEATGHEDALPANPLRVWAAIRMALAFQLALIVIGYVRHRWPTTGMYPTAALLGLTDVDALTVSMNRTQEEMSPRLAARLIATGILANNVAKLALAATLGDARFRRWAGGGLLLMALVGFVALWLF